MAAVVAAMLLLLVPTALAAGVTRVEGQAGDRSVTPRVPSDLDREYRHAIGVLSLDLSSLQLPAGTTPLKISMGAGQVEVTVPWDAEVEASASVGAGTFDLFGDRQTGVNLDGRSRSAGQPGAPVLVITGEAGAGEIIVRRGYEPFTHQTLRTGQPVPLSCYPSGATDPSGAVSSAMHCSAADGVTKIPALACAVADTGSALCRPVGEPEPTVDFANEPGTRHCQVPAGGGPVNLHRSDSRQPHPLVRRRGIVHLHDSRGGRTVGLSPHQQRRLRRSAGARITAARNAGIACDARRPERPGPASCPRRPQHPGPSRRVPLHRPRRRRADNLRTDLTHR